jgi:hypothetical protein
MSLALFEAGFPAEGSTQPMAPPNTMAYATTKLIAVIKVVTNQK